MRRLILLACVAALAACGAPAVKGPALPQCPKPAPGDTTILQIAPQSFIDPRGEVAPIIGDDLRRTGRVTIVAASDPGGAKPDYVVTGGLRDDAVEVHLVDPAQGCQLLAQAFAVEESTPMRYVAHRASDAIHEKLFGIPGAASSSIAYVEGPVDAGRLVVADSDAATASVVASSKEPLMAPVWSPDHESLAFIGTRGGQRVIFVQTVRKGDLRMVADDAGIDPYVGWIGPSQLAFGLTVGANLDIYAQPAHGGARTRLTDDPHRDSEPDAPADGRILSFTSDRSGTRQVHVLDLRTHELRQVTTGPAEHFHARFSPDGKQLAVVAKDAAGSRIELVDVATGQSRRLTNGPHDDWPSFSPNGLSVAYTVKESDGTTYIVVATVNGKGKHLIRGEDPRQPAFSSFVGTQ